MELVMSYRKRKVDPQSILAVEYSKYQNGSYRHMKVQVTKLFVSRLQGFCVADSHDPQQMAAVLVAGHGHAVKDDLIENNKTKTQTRTASI